MSKLAFIGVGNMGSAILRGIIADGYVQANQISVFDKNTAMLGTLCKDFPGLQITGSAVDAVCNSQYIILAVKPNVIGIVIDEIKPYIAGKKIISIAAGWTIEMLGNALAGSKASYLRVMPNTPAMVSEGMTAICTETTFAQEDFSYAKGIFDSIGRTVLLPERLFDSAIAISGSSPAYVYMMIEAMADGGVREGLGRATAIEMAAQAVLGSALMVLTSGTHPAALKDAVCSPGGTTIDAVVELENSGFRSAILKAMEVCADKSRYMSNKK